MTAVAIPTALAVPDAPTFKKKRVLLIDTSSHKRELRTEIMRKLGIDVDSAADISEARSWWKANFYDLVLVNAGSGEGQRDKFCDDVRASTPSQRFAFLVGKPEYLSDSPSPDAFDQILEGVATRDVTVALPVDAEDLPQRWGILEASRQISAVRSACNARTQAMRNRPSPPRDLTPRQAKNAAAGARTLDDLLRKDMQ